MKILVLKIINDTFYLALITFIVYFVLELIKPGLISNYFDLNLLLIITIILGILITITKKYDSRS